jgi:REP element-mobilizing transposase RayT
MKGFSYRGKFQYFLTFCTAERQPIFTDEQVASSVARQILQDAAACAFAVPAYVLMPDHGHWLFDGLTDSSSLRPFVKLTKQNTGFAFRRQTGRFLWQDGYHDTVIRDGVHLLDVIRYIVENPVRAGLVQSPEEYPLWGSGTTSREEILKRLSEDPRRTWEPL